MPGMSRPEFNPNAPDPITLPDTYVYTESDDLSTLDAPVENGTGDQTGGLGPL